MLRSHHSFGRLRTFQVLEPTPARPNKVGSDSRQKGGSRRLRLRTLKLVILSCEKVNFKQIPVSFGFWFKNKASLFCLYKISSRSGSDQPKIPVTPRAQYRYGVKSCSSVLYDDACSWSGHYWHCVIFMLLRIAKYRPLPRLWGWVTITS